MISVENLHKSYGSQILFDGVSFKINHRERVGLVGRNGHGKTTLIKILIGQEDYDDGTITSPKNYRIGHVSQQLVFTKKTILEEGMQGLPPTEKDHHWKVEKILFGLGFSQEDLTRSPDVFSGGYQVRLNLAKILVSEPDLLLLDEPTNYLDITSIRWIEQFLLSWPHELILITHDRSFMDKIVTHTVGIHRQKARKIAGNTEKYYSQVAQDEEIYEKTRLNDERREKEIRLFITRFRAKARLANMVQSRIKTLAKMEKKDKLDQVKNLEFTFRHYPLRAKQIMAAQNIHFGYNSRQQLIKGVDFSVNAGDRICVVGQNGKGKTTLLKLIADKLHPQKGHFTFNPNVITGFYEQTNVQSLVNSRTVEEEILYSHSDVDRQAARNICGAMMFEGDNALKKIAMLSGGEKCRVMLGKLLVTPVNLLLLDEPTNHLDMESCDALLAAIDNFDGTVIMVTHNEMFLHALATRLIVFQNDTVDIFEGSYQRFLESGGWNDESSSNTPVKEVDSTTPLPKLTKKELRKLRSEIMSERAKVIKPIDDRIAALEEKIEEHESRLEVLNTDMLEASQAQNGPRIAQISQDLHHYQSAVDKGFEELEILYNQKEAKDAVYQKRLAQLND
ncbi:MAG: ABC-F family ATP-binding cassette domain-containing protein [Desulfobacteraceae bacterium]|jgi:ATP-binding cassette subfamily F protein 3